MNLLKSKTVLFTIAAGAWTIFVAMNKANHWIVISDEVNEIVLTLVGGGIITSMRHAVQKAKNAADQSSNKKSGQEPGSGGKDQE